MRRVVDATVWRQLHVKNVQFLGRETTHNTQNMIIIITNEGVSSNVYTTDRRQTQLSKSYLRSTVNRIDTSLF